MPERGGQVGLADPDRAQDQSAAGVVEEPQASQFVPQFAVVADGAVAVEGVQAHGGVEFGGAGAQRGGGAVAAVDLVGEHQCRKSA